jgi:hypothetical protein
MTCRLRVGRYRVVYTVEDECLVVQVIRGGGRWLRVVVNVAVTPSKRITVFLDRRLSRQT